MVSYFGMSNNAYPLPAQVDLPPANVSKLQAAALRFSDDVEQGDWSGATEQLRRIVGAARPILTRFDAAGEPLTKAVVRLARAVQRHDRAGALHGDNKLLEWTAVTFRQPDVPVEVAHLGYLSRELRLLANEDQPKKLAARVAEVRQSWNKLVAAFSAGGDPSIIQDGETIIHQLELAATPTDLLQVQGSLDKLVERINQAFEREKE